jgi:hypothetical protein
MKYRGSVPRRAAEGTKETKRIIELKTSVMINYIFKTLCSGNENDLLLYEPEAEEAPYGNGKDIRCDNCKAEGEEGTKSMEVPSGAVQPE